MMFYILSIAVYLIIGSILTLFYIGAAGYPHRFSWKNLIKRLLDDNNIWYAIGVIVFWLPILIIIVSRSLWNRIKER